MRAHRLLAVAAAAATAACSGDVSSPTAPKAPALAPSLAVYSYSTLPAAPATCPTVRTYDLDEIAWSFSMTALVNGAAGPATSVSNGSLEYELVVDPLIVADLQASANAGCTANLQFHTYGYTHTSGVGMSEYEGHIRAGAQRPGIGTWITLGRVDLAWAQPPAPGSCASLSCGIGLHHLVEIGPVLQANIASGDLLRVEGISRARADAGGVAATDEAQASFTVDPVVGVNSLGPRLVIYLP